jgi:hypothetical protein
VNTYWRSVMFGVVLVGAIWLTNYFFPYRAVNDLLGHRFGHSTVSLLVDAVLIFAVIPVMLKLFKS